MERGESESGSGDGEGGTGRGESSRAGGVGGRGGGSEGMEPLLAIHVRSEARAPPDPANQAWNVTLEAMGR